ncbi:major facilitator superfamily domain-containing protein, partial [Xylogone sp. PMI_703]
MDSVTQIKNEEVSSPNSKLQALEAPGSGVVEDAQQPEPEPPTPYTRFTRNETKLLTLLLGLTTITSPLTATIYYPLLPLLRSHFHVSAQAINMTITLYVIFQALSPAIFGPLSDTLGRRPIYLVTLSLYMVGNLGLALNKSSYRALLGLRAVQSLGASAAYAVSFGVVADVAMPSERGKIVGPMSMALNLGACVGPVIGGWVAYTSGSYEWVFWALVIIGGAIWSAVVILLPETARYVLGNRTSSKQLHWLEQSGWSLCKSWLQKRRTENDVEKQSQLQVPLDQKSNCNIFKRLRIRNPLAPLHIIFHLDTFLILWMHSSFYSVDYSLVAAIPDIYKNTYHLNELKIGLSYLPRGVGIILGGYCVGKLLDHNYKVTARKIGWKVNDVSGDNLRNFPIELARSRGSFLVLVVSTATLVGYGWVVAMHAHISVLLVLQFIEGLWSTYFYTVYSTLLVDVFPDTPSTAAAASSITRCGMAAAAIAILQPLLDAAGRGWYFTALGIWSGGCGVVVVCLIRAKGMTWRTKRLSKNSGREDSGP